jgi:transcriptional regulator with XRE-family HTH domain
MKHDKLISARKARGYSQNQMASKIAMEQTTYSRKEIGKSPITDAEWDKFAKTLEVSVEDIKSEKAQILKNEGCTFTENSIGIQYINMPQNVFDIIIKYNKKLEEDNESLKLENSLLKQKS